MFIVVGVVNLPDGPFKRPHPCECGTTGCGVHWMCNELSDYVHNVFCEWRMVNDVCCCYVVHCMYMCAYVRMHSVLSVKCMFTHYIT